MCRGVQDLEQGVKVGNERRDAADSGSAQVCAQLVQGHLDLFPGLEILYPDLPGFPLPFPHEDGRLRPDRIGMVQVLRGTASDQVDVC